MVQITYDSEFSKFVYESILPLIKDRACPFCKKRLGVANFAGAFHYQGEPRLIHKDITCLLDYVKYQEKTND